MSYIGSLRGVVKGPFTEHAYTLDPERVSMYVDIRDWEDFKDMTGVEGERLFE